MYSKDLLYTIFGRLVAAVDGVSPSTDLAVDYEDRVPFGDAARSSLALRFAEDERSS